MDRSSALLRWIGLRWRQWHGVLLAIRSSENGQTDEATGAKSVNTHRSDCCDRLDDVDFGQPAEVGASNDAFGHILKRPACVDIYKM